MHFVFVNFFTINYFNYDAISFPQMPDTVLIEFTLTDTTVDAFMANSSSFLTLLRQLLIKSGMTHVVVKIYAAISAEDNSNNRDTTTPIMLALTYKFNHF